MTVEPAPRVDQIPFNRPHATGRETAYIAEAVANAHISGDGAFTARCRERLLRMLGAPEALLVASCTAALEMSAMLVDAGPGDEVILPSYTFVTTANAFVLRGATPVFVDIRPDTLNLDETLVEASITSRTRAIVPVHYAGVACAMDELIAIGARHDVPVIEDAAQGIGASYRGRPLGTIGSLGTISFHETKNVTCGEGGALVVNAPELVERAELLREKGTNRSRFYRGQVDKYTWVDLGSSYVLSDLAAAFLLAQLEDVDSITARRRRIWATYHDAFAELEDLEIARRPVVPDDCEANAHMYYLLMPDLTRRSEMLLELERRGVNAVFHYVPLHSSPAGQRYGRVSGSMHHTDDCSDRLLRLPLWPDMSDAEVEYVCTAVREVALAVIPASASR